MHEGDSRLMILPGTEGQDLLGEGPWWSVRDSSLLWVDIRGRKIRSSRLDGSDAFSLDTPSEIGFVVPAAEGSLVAGLRDGIYAIDPATESFTRMTSPAFDSATHRINDGKADRAGRLWYGTIHDDESLDDGFLYTYANGAERQVRGGVTTSNGLGWSPDNSTFYYTDSMAFTITAYDYDISSGEASNPREFARDTGYRPDGLTVDADGCVWSAKWNGGMVVQYDPSGAVMRTLRLPVSRPTSCAFVGPDLTTLAVTSAQPDEPGTEPLAGSVFLVDAGARGLPETPFAG